MGNTVGAGGLFGGGPSVSNTAITNSMNSSISNTIIQQTATAANNVSSSQAQIVNCTPPGPDAAGCTACLNAVGNQCTSVCGGVGNPNSTGTGTSLDLECQACLGVALGYSTTICAVLCNGLAATLAQSPACVQCGNSTSTTCAPFCFACVFINNVQDQTITFNASISITSAQTTTTQTAASMNLTQQASTSSDAVSTALNDFFGAHTSNTDVLNISNFMQTNLSQSLIQSAVTTCIVSQSQVSQGSSIFFAGNSQSQNVSLIVNVLMSNSQYASAINTYAAAVSQSTSTSFSLFSLGGIIILVVIIIIVFGAIYAVIHSRNKRIAMQEQINAANAR